MILLITPVVPQREAAPITSSAPFVWFFKNHFTLEDQMNAKFRTLTIAQIVKERRRPWSAEPDLMLVVTSGTFLSLHFATFIFAVKETTVANTNLK